MPILSEPGLLRRLLLPVLLLSGAPAAFAQVPAGAVVQPLPKSDDPAELLAQALRTLATEPANLAALTAAGHNALVLGDPNAAVGFFGRAQEIAPRDGAIKAGLGSALVQLEKPQDALRLFAEASRLGVPDADIAEDRGLAYDLAGQQRLAQRDYQTVLAGHPEDEAARRRLALSQGISGDKAAAIATLDPLIRKRDIAGWRAQTFVLAMDGDAKGANDITRIMLPQQSAMLQPFLVRLATLSPADKARAVHFGEMPAGGSSYTPTQVASVDTPATYAAAAPRSDLAPQPASGPRATVPPVRTASAPVRSTQTASAPAAPGRSAYQGQSTDQSAPLAGIALTPAQPSSGGATVASSVSTRPAPVSAPPTQVAQAMPLPGLPMPAAEGHYDLPHDAAMKSGARPTRSAPPSMRTVGTPVVHKTASTAPETADADASAGTKAPTKPGRALATTDDTESSAKTRKALAAAEGCAPVKTARRSRTRGHVAKPSTRCTALAATDDADLATSAKDKKASLAAADDCVPTKSTSRSKTRRGHVKPATHCTALATAADDDATTVKSKKTLDEDCVPVAHSAGRKARGKTAKARTHCTATAAADDSDATGTSAKSRKALAAADEDCAPATRSRSRSKTKGKTAKASTRCTALAVGDDDTTAAKATKAKTARGKAASDESDDKAASKSVAGRVYVQVAGGANKDDMTKAWADVKKKAPELMKGKSPSTTPLRATNRLLVGPFKDEDEAQAFVNKLAGKGLSGFTVKSTKGQKVEKLDAGS